MFIERLQVHAFPFYSPLKLTHYPLVKLEKLRYYGIQQQFSRARFPMPDLFCIVKMFHACSCCLWFCKLFFDSRSLHSVQKMRVGNLHEHRLEWTMHLFSWIFEINQEMLQPGLIYLTKFYEFAFILKALCKNEKLRVHSMIFISVANRTNRLSYCYAMKNENKRAQDEILGVVSIQPKLFIWFEVFFTRIFLFQRRAANLLQIFPYPLESRSLFMRWSKQNWIHIAHRV